MGRFHAWVWSTSIAVGLTVGSMGDYRPNLHMCFTCHIVEPAVSDVLADWLLLFAWVLGYWTYACAVLLDAWRRLFASRRGWSQRLSSRAAQLRATATYVGIIGAQWVFTGITFALIFNQDYDAVEEGGARAAPRATRVAFAVSMGLLGVADLVCWLVTSSPALREFWLHRRLRKVLQESDEDSVDDDAVFQPGSSFVPVWHGHQLRSDAQAKAKERKKKAKEAELGDISETLRREFVQFTVAGIGESLKITQQKDRASREAQHPREMEMQPTATSRHESHDFGGACPACASAASGTCARGGVCARGGGGGGGVRLSSSIDSMAASLSGLPWALGFLGGRAPIDDLPAAVALLDAAFTETNEVTLEPGVMFTEVAPRAFERLRTEVYYCTNDDYLSSLLGSEHPGRVVDQVEAPPKALPEPLTILPELIPAGLVEIRWCSPSPRERVAASSFGRSTGVLWSKRSKRSNMPG